MKRLLTIGQVAARLGRSVDFVRQRTDDGQLKAEPRGKGKYRHYTEAAVAAYEAKEQRHRPPPRAQPQPKRPSPPPRPPRPARPAIGPALFPDDERLWDDELDVEPPTPPSPHAPSPAERVYLDTLIVVGMLGAPWGGASCMRTLSSTSPSNASRWETAPSARPPLFDTMSRPFSPRIMTRRRRRKNESARVRRPPRQLRSGGAP